MISKVLGKFFASLSPSIKWSINTYKLWSVCWTLSCTCKPPWRQKTIYEGYASSPSSEIHGVSFPPPYIWRQEIIFPRRLMAPGNCRQPPSKLLCMSHQHLKVSQFFIQCDCTDSGVHCQTCIRDVCKRRIDTEDYL